VRLCAGAGARRGGTSKSVGARVWRGGGGRERRVRGDGADAAGEEGARGSKGGCRREKEQHAA
jgi:hypothetical protein